MVKFFLLVLSFFGWKPKPPPAATAKLAAATSSPPAVRPHIRTQAQEARDTVELLHRHERAHVLGVGRPSDEAAAAGWKFLEDLALSIAGYLRACIHLGISWPLCPRGSDPDVWLTDLLERVGHEIDNVVTAILGGCVLRAWRAVENVMARAVEHKLRGCTPVVVYAGGPEAKREVHVRDSVRSEEHPNGRVIVARAYEHGRGGHLEVLDRDGAKLSQKTVRRSGWTVCDGWIAISGPTGRSKPVSDEGDSPSEVNKPTSDPQP